MADDEQVLPWYGNVVEWCDDWLRWTFRPQIDGRSRVWLARWWEVDEAVCRLDALWQAWEAARVQGGDAMSAWWLMHADPCLRLLMAPDGPLSRGIEGAENRSRRGEPLPFAQPDYPEMFPLEDHLAPCHAGVTFDDEQDADQ
ncbi:MAG: DUF4913 domain-containing protein [Propionibacteriaceae bacterium]|jgi:hypothetical protein|nr:DUF4913 domain-containing protein [Propionibacteriaceae bacterium]